MAAGAEGGAARGAEAGLTRRVCMRLASIRAEDLPPAVIATTKRFVLDALGCVGAGARAPGIGALLGRLRAWEPDGSATVLVGKRRASPPTAALANAAAGHALDFDDQHDPARVHSFAEMVAAALAAAEDRGGVGGLAFVAAVAVGAELHARLGLACYNAIGKGWLPTVGCGTLASAVAAGRILGLDGERLVHAVGIALHQMSGTIQARDDQAQVKRLGPGFAARSGVLAAFLAADGVTGAHRSFEGKGGVFALFERGEAKPELVEEKLGRVWRVLDYSMKPFPCCRCSHTVIDLGLGLHQEGIREGHVERAEIYMSRVNHEAVAGPYDAARASPSHAQFNATYALARAIADGRVDLASFEPAAITDAGVAALARRIETLVDPAMPDTAAEPARVRLWLGDGRVLERASEVMIGSPKKPMSEREALEKFQNCLAYGLGADRAAVERLAETALRLDRLRDIRELVAAFPAAPALDAVCLRTRK